MSDYALVRRHTVSIDLSAVNVACVRDGTGQDFLDPIVKI